MARLALSKLGLSGNLLKTSIDWPRLDKAGPGWTRPAWAGQGQWKSPFRVVDWPGPAWAGLGLARPALFSDFYWPELARAGPGQPCPVWASPGRPGLARASPARPLFCTGHVTVYCYIIHQNLLKGSRRTTNFFKHNFHKHL